MSTLAVAEDISKDLPLPPGRTGLPWIGETLQFIRNPFFLEAKYERFGSVFRTHVFGKNTVVMVGPEAAQFVLQKGASHFSSKEGWPKTYQELIGPCLFLQDGEEHKRVRSTLMPAFHSSMLSRYADTIDTVAHEYCERWSQSGTIVWYEEYRKLTFDILSRLLFGSRNLQESIDSNKKFILFARGLNSLPIRFPGTHFTRALQARNEILEHLDAVIEARRTHPENDAISLLVDAKDEHGRPLSKREIQSQTLLLAFAGHETTSSLLTNFHLALIKEPKIWEQARKEQLELSEQDGLDTIRNPQKNLYLDRVLKETERMYPPVSGIFRGVWKPFVFAGYRIPKGWLVLFSIAHTHKMPSIYPNPEIFDPDRFLPENIRNRPQLSLVGFGGGKKFCLGYAFAQLEAKIIASRLLRDYTWELDPNQDLSLKILPVLHPKDGLRVKIRKR